MYKAKSYYSHRYQRRCCTNVWTGDVHWLLVQLREWWRWLVWCLNISLLLRHRTMQRELASLGNNVVKLSCSRCSYVSRKIDCMSWWSNQSRRLLYSCSADLEQCRSRTWRNERSATYCDVQCFVLRYVTLTKTTFSRTWTDALMLLHFILLSCYFRDVFVDMKGYYYPSNVAQLLDKLRTQFRQLLPCFHYQTSERCYQQQCRLKPHVRKTSQRLKSIWLHVSRHKNMITAKLQRISHVYGIRRRGGTNWNTMPNLWVGRDSKIAAVNRK